MKFRFLREASWSQQKIVSLCLCFSLVLLTACGKQGGVPASAPITAKSEAVSAQPAVDSEGNAVLETAETLGPDFDDAITQEPIEEDATVAGSLSGSLVEVGSKVGYELPDYQAAWGLSRAVYDKAVTFMDLNGRQFNNQRYVILIDMSKHSSKRRLFLFDLETGRMETHNVAHGSGSDPNATGYAKFFSNVANSQKTSLGAYKTAATYNGKHGLQLRLIGLEGTNSNALSRGVVLHGANYVSDGSHAGRSWGCPAVDQRISSSIIGRVKGGAFLLIWK